MGRFIDITGAPIASDFQEMPLDFMSKALDVKQKSLDTFRSDADKGLPVDVGLRTEWVKKYADETYTPELERIAKNAVANPQGAGRELTSLRTKMAKDPFIAKAKLDAAARDFVTKNEYTLKQEGKPILDYRDAQGNIIQMSKEDLLNKDFDLGTWYDATGYGDYIKEIRDKFSKSLPEKGKYVRDILPSLQDFTSKGLGQLMLQGKTITEVDRREIKELNDDIDAEYRRLMNDGGKDARYFRKEHGLKQGDMSEATEKFVKNDVLLPEAKTFMYNWDSTVTDMSYSANPNGSGKDKDPTKVLPLKSNFENSPYSFDDFKTSAEAAAKSRNEGWNNVKSKITSLSPKVLAGAKIAGINKAVTENDLNKLIKYAQTVDPATLSDPDRLALYKANKDAVQYFAAKRTLDFYGNQVASVVDDAVNEYIQKNPASKSTDAFIKTKTGNYTFTEWAKKQGQDVKNDIKLGKFSLSPDFAGAAPTDLQKIIREKMAKKGSLNISNAYISLDPTSKGYSKTSYDLANNIWDNASQKGVVFEGQSLESDPSKGKAELFEKLTGEKPTGKLKPVGAAIDENGRIGVIVEDEGTGNTATFIKNVGTEYIPFVENYYKEIYNSDDYISHDVAAQGYMDTELTKYGLSGSFNNFIEANYPNSFDFGNTKILSDGKGTFTIGKDRFTSPAELKTFMGHVSLNSK